MGETVAAPEEAAGGAEHAEAAGGPPAGPAPEGPGAGDRAGDRSASAGRRPVRAMVAWLATGGACLLLLVALLLPNQPGHLTPAAFLRIPAEGLLALALVLLLPRRARPVAAALAGGLIGLLGIWTLFDIGFFSVLARPFDPVFDWPLVQAAMGFLTESYGRATALTAVLAAVGLAAGLLALAALGARRLSRPLSRHRAAGAGVLAALTAAWLTCALLGVQIVPGVPVAAHHTDRLLQLGTSLQDRQQFAAQASVDEFREVPAAQLLTALRGKDVLITWVESYGRDAVEDPAFDPQIGAVLTEWEHRLGDAGFAAQSGYLTAATAGGASWLNHATLRSGLWVDNQQRYRTLVGSDRFTLNRAFQSAGWRTVAVMPGIFDDWPEGEFFGFDQIYGRAELDYRGPRMNWGIIPDQYTMSAFQRLERARSGRGPVMADIALLTSHLPWTPVAPLLDWAEIDDGSVFDTVSVDDGDPAEEVMRDPARARHAYGEAVAYSLRTILSYVETYGDGDLVVIMLGDHQPAALITGEGASRDVPISIIAGDPAVLERTAGWGWQDGLRPGPEAPVWGMDAFRDEFLAAFGPAEPPQ